MSVDDASGSVTICSRGQSGLFADELGVTVRNFPRGARRFLWSDISYFADGAVALDSGGFHWVLVVVLRAGRSLPVSCTSAASADPETLAAVRQLAERYDIPADVTGVPMRDGRPPVQGLYEDPGGQTGLRYWDGSRWSPLLPPGVGKLLSATKSTARWADLPVSQERWDYPVRRAARSKDWIAAIGILIAAQLVAALAYGWAEQHSSDDVGSFCTLAAITALFLIPAWRSVRRWEKVENAADEPFNAMTTDDTTPDDPGVSLVMDGEPSLQAVGPPVRAEHELSETRWHVVDRSGTIHTFRSHRRRHLLWGIVALVVAGAWLENAIQAPLSGWDPRVGDKGLEAWDIFSVLLFAWVGIRQFRTGVKVSAGKLIIRGGFITRTVSINEIRAVTWDSADNLRTRTSWIPRVDLASGKSVWIGHLDGGPATRPPDPGVAASLDELRVLLAVQAPDPDVND